MRKRFSIALGLLAVLAVGTYLAFRTSQLYPIRSAFAGSYSYTLLFKTSTWLVPFAVLAGIFFASRVEGRKRAELVDGKIERHDTVAFFEHWSHALSTLVLLASGLRLGALFVPRTVQTPQTIGFALNLHFVGVVIFMFGIAFYLTNAYVNGTMRKHMPEAGDLEEALADYNAKIGKNKGFAPKDGKYLASEKLSYPGWIVLVGGIILTGSIKVAAHAINMPAWLMGITTFLHDLAALGVLAYLVVHIMAAAVAPWSWPLLKSMLTGYVSEDYARKNHPKWYDEIKHGKSDAGSQKKPAQEGKHLST